MRELTSYSQHGFGSRHKKTRRIMRWEISEKFNGTSVESGEKLSRHPRSRRARRGRQSVVSHRCGLVRRSRQAKVEVRSVTKRLGVLEVLWSHHSDSNRRPLPYHGSALPTELWRPFFKRPSGGCRTGEGTLPKSRSVAQPETERWGFFFRRLPRHKKRRERKRSLLVISKGNTAND